MTREVPDLTCRELVELVTDYLEVRLPADDRLRFELHLTYCVPCRTYLKQMRQVLASAGQLTEDSIAPAARDELLRAFRDWKKGSGGGSS
ncbi:MAG TPA: zf-HC2 domain-containing protein [Anaeromyxobacteraceae bacterium]|nr:zf-HC2 domain-containing protein [Anaeromyxobacteraceae bacterium]